LLYQTLLDSASRSDAEHKLAVCTSIQSHGVTEALEASNERFSARGVSGAVVFSCSPQIRARPAPLTAQQSALVAAVRELEQLGHVDSRVNLDIHFGHRPSRQTI
jgi:hypothetical protein